MMMAADFPASYTRLDIAGRLEHLSLDVGTVEHAVRGCFCPRCALTVVRPAELPYHLVVCSGTS
jgi:CO dehydrogenase nickel-insertion accessory protein CooC1